MIGRNEVGLSGSLGVRSGEGIAPVAASIVESARRERLEALLSELDRLGCGWRLDLALARLECRPPEQHLEWVHAGGFAGVLSAYRDCVRIEGGAPMRPRRRVNARLRGGSR